MIVVRDEEDRRAWYEFLKGTDSIPLNIHQFVCDISYERFNGEIVKYDKSTLVLKY